MIFEVFQYRHQFSFRFLPLLPQVLQQITLRFAHTKNLVDQRLNFVKVLQTSLFLFFDAFIVFLENCCSQTLSAPLFLLIPLLKSISDCMIR